MNRLTTNDANHIFASLNLFYAENNEVMIRGGGPEPDYADTTLVELVRRIARTHNLNIAAENPESLGDELYDAMFDGVDTVEGVVALLHAAAIQAAEMRGRLASIEDILGDSYNLAHLRELVQADRVAVEMPHKTAWISVKDSLPTEERPVLTFIGYRGTGIGFISTSSYFCFDPSPHWQWDGLVQDDQRVLFWMPLPEPPEAEQDG